MFEDVAFVEDADISSKRLTISISVLTKDARKRDDDDDSLHPVSNRVPQGEVHCRQSLAAARWNGERKEPQVLIGRLSTIVANVGSETIDGTWLIACRCRQTVDVPLQTTQQFMQRIVFKILVVRRPSFSIRIERSRLNSVRVNQRGEQHPREERQCSHTFFW
ncbi:MAG: hypothetical protein O3A00_26700 [Planctomycetota bacterium]|nr:hypothetical protein [Planctomycetota bacterium]